MNKKPDPITKKEEIKQNPDSKIDQDFEGYPSGPANDETIYPQTKNQEKTADINNKDGEKRFNEETDEQESDGSANAFEDK
jgi:hypothetical protein